MRKLQSEPVSICPARDRRIAGACLCALPAGCSRCGWVEESKADPKLAPQSKGQRPSALPSLEFSGGVVVVAEAVVVDDDAGPAGSSRGEDPSRRR